MENTLDNEAGPAIDVKWLADRCSALQVDLPRLSKQIVFELEKTVGGNDDPNAGESAEIVIERLFEAFGAGVPVWHSVPVPSALPLIALLPGVGCRIVCAVTDQGRWLVEGTEGTSYLDSFPAKSRYAQLPSSADTTGDVSVRRLFIDEILKHKRVFVMATGASVVCNILALASSLYSMQIYDRVIPTHGLETLTTLTVGVFIAMLLELIIRKSRSLILEDGIKEMDHELSHKVFRRLLSIRMDQLPGSVGTLAAQVRSYETIRSFATTATMFAFNDAPFALLFLTVIVSIAGTQVAMVVLVFFTLAMAIGFMSKAKIAHHTKNGVAGSNRKVGLLVEVVEGAESLKASGMGWQLLSRWDHLSRKVIDDSDKVKRCSETASYLSAMIQQLSYVMLVCAGAYIASTSTDLTTGGIIACSILSGRVLAPVGMLPGLIVQWGHAKASLDELEKVFKLELDNHDVDRPIHSVTVQGRYFLEDLQFSYRGRREALTVKRLVIERGEKIGIIGPIGGGKSTMLKLLAGLYKPQSGHVLLDGLDLQQISRPHLSDSIGYLPQHVHLFGGTLRYNLLLGNPRASDEELLMVCHLTGLIVIVNNNPKGLDMEIAEGGGGVSGGQKQLIGITRMILAKPELWLLDEPTASLDDSHEQRVIVALAQQVKAEQTFVLVTHKPKLLALVQRILVFSQGELVMDGPRDAVLEKLSNNSSNQAGQGGE